MKRAKLDDILSRGGPEVDTGPIEPHLHALATERKLPDLSIAICAVRFEEAAPALRAKLIKAAEGQTLSEDEMMLVFRGLHILGGARDSQACRPLLRLLRRPEEEIDDILGDAVTQSMSKIVAGVFDDDTDTLFEAIADRAADEYVRDALLGAASFLTWDGRIEAGRMRGLLQAFYEESWAEDGDFSWVGWQESVSILGLRDLAPLVRGAFAEGRIPRDALEFHHFEEDLEEAERAPRDIRRFRKANRGYIEDVLEELDWTRHAGRESKEVEGESPWSDGSLRSVAPVINPWRHVGRNDPCPCGSGKKFKKCCFALRPEDIGDDAPN